MGVVNKEAKAFVKRYNSENEDKFKGNFTLGERSLLYDALEQTQGITDLTEREANSTVVEYSIKYSGKKSLDMVIFGALTKCNMADKFQDTSKKEGTNIKFFKKGVACQ